MVFCLERGADLHMAQLMPRPPTVSCSSKIQIGFTFLVPAHLGSPGQRAVKQMMMMMMPTMDVGQPYTGQYADVVLWAFHAGLAVKSAFLHSAALCF